MSNFISIRGARVHNLKNINLDIPRNKLVVICGLSGSGKSSFAFDTIYAEGQRRYVESLSSYARQFLGMMEKPDVDQIEGLSPAISIDQKSTSRNPRSTVGTITEIYDYLRLLYARIGHPHCPRCGRPVQSQTLNQILNKILALPSDTKINLLAPLVRDKKGEHRFVFEEIRKAGYARVRVDGKIYSIEEAEDLALDKKKKHSIDVVIDRLTIGKNIKVRLADSLETALDLGNGVISIELSASGKDILFSTLFACPFCGISLPEIHPRNFSFNSPHGACPTCQGLGTKLEIDPTLVIPNKNLTLAQGAIRPWTSSSAGRQTWYQRMLESVAEESGFSINTPVKDLTKSQLDKILYGVKDKIFKVKNEETFGKVREFSTTFEGTIPNLERRYRETDSDYIRSEIERYMRIEVCPKCHGKRLRPEALAYTVVEKSIADVSNLTIEKALVFFEALEGKHKNNLKLPCGARRAAHYSSLITHHLLLSDREYKIARQILKEIKARLTFLKDVGLDYITLDRAAATLAGGEVQRIRLATQIGSGLSGVIYILDEPSIGLHQRDNARLINMLKNLRDLGNTVIVVEHDENIINSADEIIDIGPGAGKAGGEIVVQGTLAQVKKYKKSLTGAYLSGRKKIPLPKSYRKGSGQEIKILGAQEFNLKNIDVKIPLGKFVCITGVSGSGKSTLVDDILGRALAQKFYRAKERPGKHKNILGMENIDKVVRIDQSPIGRTPRSNPATYTGVFTYIRDLFAATPEARMRGYNPGRFSFNVKGGRCEACQGEGFTKIEMHFLPDVYVECEECSGKRYNKQALEIHYKMKNISEVLSMTCDEALNFFSNIPPLKQKLKILFEVGLGYVELGQPATTLSGGEAQRIKLATELSRRATGKTLYILDEPTTGLHFDDVRRLLEVLGKLADRGNTVLVIEHNLDVIKSADFICDLGPEGGEKGGFIVAQGTPKEVARNKKSYTGQFLGRYFK
jgi:excinuclease ABC subunit A